MKNILITPASWFLIGVPFMFLLGSLFHFAYEWSGKSVIVGIFTPVNESIWEHLKLSTYPTFIWYIIGFILFYNRINPYKWSICSVVSVITSAIIITNFYYTYTGALGIHSLFLDIFSLFLGLFIAQCLSLHLYRYLNISFSNFYLSTIIGLMIVICFTLFTFCPPKLPIFMDPITKQYGLH